MRPPRRFPNRRARRQARCHLQMPQHHAFYDPPKNYLKLRHHSSDQSLNDRMEVSSISRLYLGERPVVGCEDPAAEIRTASATVLVPNVVFVVEIPGALVERDFLAGGNVAPRQERDLALEP